MQKLKNIFNVNFSNNKIYQHLFKSPWNRPGKTSSLVYDIKYENNDIKQISTLHFVTGNKDTAQLDKKMKMIFNTKVETNFLSLLPNLNAGKHIDQHTGVCNTSIVWKVFGDTQVFSLENNLSVDEDYGIILNTDYPHDAYNTSANLHWIATSLIYDIKYDEVIEICKEKCLLL